MSGIKIVMGGLGMGEGVSLGTIPEVKEVLPVLKEFNVDTLDSAQLYGDAEKNLGEVGAGKEFTIDTKWLGGFKPGFITKDNIITTGKESLERLKIPQVDIFYIHAPDSTVPLEDTLAGVNEVYKLGLFKRFGLSNYKAEDVEKAYNIAKEKGYPLPQVYQGNYSPVARLQEEQLFPTLRKLNIAFYAYSPLAGGFLTKTAEDIEKGTGRFDQSKPIGKMYYDMYAKPAYISALKQWASIAEEAGATKAELAYRWVTYNSPLKRENGDAIILGARNVEQARQTLEGLKKGPLSEDVLKKIDGVWETIKHEAPLDNYHK
ncbi:oxidoreductase-like protein 13 [Elsinoe australis]|uniref:Oxidoreductase-like protein 13 n=1 Tax=Elsinoe australis TaxID=40998 RepID=A0A4U7B402_9PEZI|nr:oxidoreductase-like protein 13 [Elsinoe australis]